MIGAVDDIPAVSPLARDGLREDLAARTGIPQDLDIKRGRIYLLINDLVVENKSVRFLVRFFCVFFRWWRA